MEQRLEQLKQEQQILRVKLDEVNVLIQAYENAIAKQEEEAEANVEEKVEKQDA